MSAKRKAAATAKVIAETESTNGTVKRRKLSSNANDIDPILEAGRELLGQINSTNDKQGESIAKHFLTLPNRRKLPEYFKVITQPIALDIVEGKLNRHEYPDLEALEADVKLMVANAKDYNVKSSGIFSDAEKIRKVLQTFMTEQEKQSKSVKTQLKSSSATETEDGPAPAKSSAPRPTIKLHLKSDKAASEPTAKSQSKRKSTDKPAKKAAEPESKISAVAQDPDTQPSFEGDSFQQAQEKIAGELLTLSTVDNILVEGNFINLPNRALTDYYRTIKHPLSLRGLQKLVLGIKGHGTGSGETSLKSWEAFAREASFIWKNAREFNLEESEIVLRANQLQAYFDKRFEQAKATVQEPTQPRVKLTVGQKSPEPAPKITLKFGASKANETSASPAAPAAKDTTAPDPSVVAANESNGDDPDATDSAGRSESAAATFSAANKTDSTASNGLKREGSVHQSSAVTAPARASPRPSIPHPSAQTMHIPAAANPAPTATMTNGVVPQISSHQSPMFASQLRPPGKDASDALITNLNLSTHPSLKLGARFSLNIAPSTTRNHKSTTIALPNTHAYLQIAPTLSTSLLHRPSKTFVTCDNRRQQPLAQRDPDQIRPLFEHILSPGVNIIEVEVIAGLARGAPKPSHGPEVEIEKFTVFVHLQGRS